MNDKNGLENTCADCADFTPETNPIDCYFRWCKWYPKGVYCHVSDKACDKFRPLDICPRCGLRRVSNSRGEVIPLLKGDGSSGEMTVRVLKLWVDCEKCGRVHLSLQSKEEIIAEYRNDHKVRSLWTRRMK